MGEDDGGGHVEVLRGAQGVFGEVEGLDVQEAVGFLEEGCGDAVEAGGGEV